MEFKILGPLEVVEGDRKLPLGGAQRKALLAMLLLRANRVIGIDELVERTWGDDPPKTAEHSIQVHVSELRKILEEGGDAGGRASIVRRSLGYAIELPEQSLDVHRFERLAEQGRAALAAGMPSTSGEDRRSRTSPTTTSPRRRSSSSRRSGWPRPRIGSKPTSRSDATVSSSPSCRRWWRRTLSASVFAAS